MKLTKRTRTPADLKRVQVRHWATSELVRTHRAEFIALTLRYEKHYDSIHRDDDPETSLSRVEARARVIIKEVEHLRGSAPPRDIAARLKFTQPALYRYLGRYGRKDLAALFPSNYSARKQDPDAT